MADDLGIFICFIFHSVDDSFLKRYLLKELFLSSTNAELMLSYISGSEGDFNENKLSRGDAGGDLNADES